MRISLFFLLAVLLVAANASSLRGGNNADGYHRGLIPDMADCNVAQSCTVGVEGDCDEGYECTLSSTRTYNENMAPKRKCFYNYMIPCSRNPEHEGVGCDPELIKNGDDGYYLFWSTGKGFCKEVAE